ncbi:hypothetical protein [Clostridium sp.]|uniref:hypothetical protein n=1 Tax=Clostridium sp. TaxID=1506 RepID=UPI001D7EFDAC|nr:hypothetical protein [Clostridium sp.]MBS5307770.1 hypothetical protein [Clostridium sp.]
MSTLKKYREKALSSNKKVVFCNWKREKGKTYTIAQEIYYCFLCSRVNENKNIVVISGANADVECKNIYGFIKELFLKEAVHIKVSKDKIEIINQKDRSCTVRFVNSLNFEHIGGLAKTDKVYCDEFIPTKSEVDLILGFTKQVKIFTTYVDNEDFEYISDVENKIDKKEWISNQIEELMGEYSSIPKAENTTMRREKVLYQIKMLQDVFKIK